jgi:hypothetical protein
MGLQREQDRVTQEGRMNGDVFKPDEKWAKGEVAAIVRMAIYSKGVEIDDIASVQINCGTGAYRGYVVLLDGSKVRV